MRKGHAHQIIAFIVWATLSLWASTLNAQPVQLQHLIKRVPFVIVVSSCPILTDMTREIGGERVKIQTLAQDAADVTAYAVTPRDARRLRQADLILMNGLGLDNWMERLIKTSETKARIKVVSEGIAPLKIETEAMRGKTQEEKRKIALAQNTPDDPRAWLSPKNAKQYAMNIRNALIAVDPGGKTTYDLRSRDYIEALERLDAAIQKQLAPMTTSRRALVVSTEGFSYFGRDYNLRFFSLKDLTGSNQTSAVNVARIIQKIRKEQASALFIDNIKDQKFLEELLKETGLRTSESLHADSLIEDKGYPASYLGMMQRNVDIITKALQQAKR
jgi:zinc/manganese transport system substrate-binding protein